MGKGNMNWDGTADQKLLLAILANHDIKVNYEAVAVSFGSHCTPRAVQERIKKLKLMAKKDNVSSPDSTPSKAPTAATKKAAVPKFKANAKSKFPKGNVQTLKKRKANNGGIAAVSTDSDEGSLTEGDSTPSKKAHSRAINGVGTKKPVLVNKRKIDEMLVFGDGNNSHTVVEEEDTVVKEEPFIFDGDLSDISAFDPAEDQLLAEQEFSLAAI